MEINLESLPESRELLEKIIVNLYHELHTYKEKYLYLLEELRLEKQRRFSPSSEKNDLQPDIFDEADVEVSEEVKEEIQDDIQVSAHTGKKHPIRKPLPADLPRETIIHDIPEVEKTCGCGTSLTRIGEEITEQLKYIPAKLSVIQHLRPKYACKACQENVKIAPMPLLLLPKSIAAPELVAHIIISKYSDHIPLYRQETIWRRLNIDLARSSLCGWILKTAELCEPLIRLLQKTLMASDYIHADETTVQVLEEKDRKNTATSYMWVYKGGDIQKPSIVFNYQQTRAGLHDKTFLVGFKGYLQTDEYSGYNFIEQEKEIIPLGCMAHARRPFAELAKLSNNTGSSFEALKYFQKLYAIEKEAKENHLSSEERYQLRNNKAPPILHEFKNWLEKRIHSTSEQAKIGKAIRYCLNHWTELTNYLKDGKLEIDNNAVENAIRPFAVGHKNSYDLLSSVKQ